MGMETDYVHAPGLVEMSLLLPMWLANTVQFVVTSIAGFVG